MKSSLLLITGWAHGIETLQSVADALEAKYDVQILTGAQVLNDRSIPSADYIVASSMGGLLALELLPESCRKLVLISSTAKFCANEDYPCGTPVKILNRMIRQLKRDPETVLEEFFKNVHYPHPSIPNQPDGSPNDWVTGLEYLLSADLRPQAQNLKIPVLLLHGTDDRIIPATAAEWLHRHLPDSRLRIFENDGHALPAHHFDEVMGEIARFFQ